MLDVLSSPTFLAGAAAVVVGWVIQKVRVVLARSKDPQDHAFEAAIGYEPPPDTPKELAASIGANLLQIIGFIVIIVAFAIN